MTLSPNGRELLVATRSSLVILDAQTGRQLRALPGIKYRGSDCTVGWSRQRIFAFTRSSPEIQLQDSATGQVLHTVNNPQQRGFVATALSPDGGHLATVHLGRRVLSIWSPPEPQPVAELISTGPRGFRSVAFSSDGRRLLTGSADGAAELWDSQSGRLLQTLWEHPAVTYAAFSTDGKRIATIGENRSAGLFDGQTRRLIRMLAPPGSVPSHGKLLAFTPDSRRVALVGKESEILIFDTVLGRPLLALPQRHALDSILFSPDGQHLITADATQPGLRLHPTTHSALFAFGCRALATVSPDAPELVQEEPTLVALLRACRRLHLDSGAQSAH